MTERVSLSSEPRLAILFPGQASQYVGMGVALREASRQADEIFHLAESITQIPIGELCANGPLDQLTRTHVAQTTVVATSLAAAAVLEERLGRRISAVATAGHSVGELAAMCFAGALTVDATLRLVHERGRLVQRDSVACDGTMVAVLGLASADLEPICREVSSDENGHVEVANLNAPGQVIISGERSAIERASEAARAAGARRILQLNVGGPFHSIYMTAAAKDMELVASRAPIVSPRIPIVLNTTAEPVTDPETLRAELATQINSPVRWEDTIRRLVAMGCTTFVELGPGEVLTGMTRRIAPDARAMAAETPEAIQQVVELIKAEG